MQRNSCIRLISAPFEGVSDRAARALWFTLGADLTTSERVNTAALLRDDLVAWHKATSDPAAAPTIVQITPPATVVEARRLAALWRLRAPLPAEIQITIDLPGLALPSPVLLTAHATPFNSSGALSGASLSAPDQQQAPQQHRKGPEYSFANAVSSKISDSSSLARSSAGAVSDLAAVQPLHVRTAAAQYTLTPEAEACVSQLNASAAALRSHLRIPISLKLRLPGASHAARAAAAAALLPRLNFDSVTVHAADTRAAAPGSVEYAHLAASATADGVDTAFAHARALEDVIASTGQGCISPMLWPSLALARTDTEPSLAATPTADSHGCASKAPVAVIVPALRLNGGFVAASQVAAAVSAAQSSSPVSNAHCDGSVPAAQGTTAAAVDVRPAAVAAEATGAVEAVVLGRGLLLDPRLALTLRHRGATVITPGTRGAHAVHGTSTRDSDLEEQQELQQQQQLVAVTTAALSAPGVILAPAKPIVSLFSYV